MTLARAWKRQLYGASSAALIVPCAMFAALLVLALGGGFGQIGVLGQIFAGPPAPSVGGASGSHGAGATHLASGALPVIPGAPRPAARSPLVRAGGGHGGVVPLAGRPGRTGGALAPVAGAAPVVTQGAGGGTHRPAPPAPRPGGSAPAPSGSAPPSPNPSREPTPVDTIVTVVTPVTQQVPAPAGTVVTQAVQSAGSTADSLLPPAPPTPQGPAVR